jgi:hypothetical protein
VFLDVPDADVDLESIDRDFRKKMVSGVNIHDETITFYEKYPDELVFESDTSPFVGEPLLFAAVFAADKQMYDCGLQAAFLKLNHVSEIIYDRAQAIQKNLSITKPECVYLLENFETLLADSGIVAAGLDISQTAGAVKNVAAAARSIERENKNLIKLSCPEIY